jgi:hypothetical protein
MTRHGGILAILLMLTAAAALTAQFKNLRFDVSTEAGHVRGTRQRLRQRRRYGDVVMPGAFRMTLQEHGHRVVIDWLSGWILGDGRPPASGYRKFSTNTMSLFTWSWCT